ncbi:F0F1 ATP synthase subunit B family protein [Nitratifractor sp.]
MRKKSLLLIAAMTVPALLAAGGHGEEAGQYLAITGRETDFVPRLFNFLVFAGLLYYLIADPVRNFFKGRREEIASKLEEIERRLQEAKEARKAAEQALAESEKKAEEILKEAEKEAELLAQRYREIGERELDALERQFRERMELEERKMQRETIVAILDENIGADDIPLNSHQVVDILEKKVA